MNYQFFKLAPKQLEEFNTLKSAGKTSKHGPLELNEQVGMHKHGEKAMYIVKGVAEFYGNVVKRVVGDGKKLNAVLVNANQLHGWLGKLKGTEIDQVHGSAFVNRVLAAA